MPSVKYQRKNGNGRNYKCAATVKNVTQRKTQKVNNQFPAVLKIKLSAGTKLNRLLLTKCSEMSTHTDRSAWSPEEVDSLENIDKEIQLVSTSSESSRSKENGSVNKSKVISDSPKTGTVGGGGGQSKKNSSSSAKLHSSCDDLSLWTKETKSQDQKINRSSTFVSLKHNKKTKAHNYDHVQSKIKHYFKAKMEPKPPKPAVINSIKESSDKEDYLEQINKQLTKELDEKNAILTLLQENYERLLFKYAEAQNRIDELRFKSQNETTESKNFFQAKHNTQITSQFGYNDNYGGKTSDAKCQKAVVAPFIKSEEPVDESNTTNRPSSLPLDNSLKLIERDMKATTPTDSEGLSSIITSMSGHSKILNSLDEENQMNKKSNYLKYQTKNFILEENSVNDPFDKVKKWQNSLPPLEQIETPETTLYNVFANNTEAYSSSDTKYKNVCSPKKDFSDESCPDSWREDYFRAESEKKSESPRAVSLPNNFSKRKRSHHDKADTPKTDVPSACIIQQRQKRPPLLRCSSLPAYDHDSVKSGNFKNGIYIPPLDLGNVTLSDEESYCQQDYYPSRPATSSSFITSRGNSIDRSIQTPQSFSSCKATISEENSSYPRASRATITKSTSITPDRSRAMDLFFASKYERRKTPTSGCIKECGECDKTRNWCNVCGESISGDFYKNKSNSCESVHHAEAPRKESRKTKPPFKRSVSFGSETLTPKFSHENSTPRNLFSRSSQDSLDNFDVYASNLKARSQVVIKALTAHVNNCTH